MTMLPRVSILLTLLASVLLTTTPQLVVASHSFTIHGDSFIKDGTPFRVFSGSFHYFRVHPTYWGARLDAMKAAGLNAVQTYVPWNIHEPTPGQFEFGEKNAWANVTRFVSLAAERGLVVLLRPGPYVCGEWEYGGFPYWLTSAVSLQRSADPAFLDAVQRFWTALFGRLEPHLFGHGGPIVMVQVENEYGSYGNDVVYQNALVDMLEKMIDPTGAGGVLLYSTDGPIDQKLESTDIPRVYQTVDFGTTVDAEAAFAMQRKYQATGPLHNSEFYPGWLTHWGDAAWARVNTSAVVSALDKILSLNASVNFYMFVGSTNFGFMNGANTQETLNNVAPQITSYDYDAPISEAGELRDKYFAIRKVLAKYTTLPSTPPVQPKPPASFGRVELTHYAPLWDALDILAPTPTHSYGPLTFEALHQAYGYVLYRTYAPWPSGGLLIQDLRDRAHVFVGGKRAGSLLRNVWSPNTLPLEIPSGGAQLDVLVQNLGRVNFGPFVQPSGSVGVTMNMRIGELFLSNYTMYSLPMESVTMAELAPVLKSNFSADSGPLLLAGKFQVDEPADTFLNMCGFGSGVVYVNGFNLGRFWPAKGPQLDLYVPGPVLRAGGNELVVFDLEPKAEAGSVSVRSEAARVEMC